MASMLLNIIITVFVGHLNSAIELSAVVLANSVYNVTGEQTHDVTASHVHGVRLLHPAGEVGCRLRMAGMRELHSSMHLSMHGSADFLVGCPHRLFTHHWYLQCNGHILRPGACMQQLQA